MFGFKDRDKGARKESEERDPGVLVAPGTEITYKPTLIEKYKQDHEALHEVFDEVLTAVQESDSKTFLLKLRDLQIALRRHLLDEELNLYIYLRHCYTGDKLKQEMINKFKRRSKKVGSDVFNFISKLSEEGYVISYDEDFISELVSIGNLLQGLLETEESVLYPIYRKPLTMPA